jgi:hypothetical protein
MRVRREYTLIKETKIYCEVIYQVRRPPFCNEGEGYVIPEVPHCSEFLIHTTI